MQNSSASIVLDKSNISTHYFIIFESFFQEKLSIELILFAFFYNFFRNFRRRLSIGRHTDGRCLFIKWAAFFHQLPDIRHIHVAV